MPRFGRILARLIRRIAQLAFVLLVALALYMVAGRLLMARVSGRVAAVEAQLSQLFNADVSIGELHGGWNRFSPTLEVSDVVLEAGSGAARARHTIGHATLALNAVASLLERRIVVARVHADGAEIELVESEQGSWALAGVAARSTGSSDELSDLLLQTGFISVTEAQLRLQRADGRSNRIGSLYVDLRNRGSEHILNAQFRVDEQLSPTHISATLEGDPRGMFAATLRAEIPLLDIGALVALPEAAGWQPRDLRGGASLQVQLDPNGIQDLRLRAEGVSLRATNSSLDRTIALDNAEFTVLARPLSPASGGWQFGFYDAAFDLQQTPWTLPAVQLDWPAADTDTMTLRARSVEAGLLRQITDTLLDLPEEAASALATLNPRGTLDKIAFEAARDGSYPDVFRVRANLRGIAVDAWGGAPAASNLQGYVEAHGRGGLVELDGNDVELHLPRLFTEAWNFDQLNARVTWALGENGAFSVGSNAIDVHDPGLDGRVSFGLYGARDSQGQLVDDLSLLVGVSRMDVAQSAAFLPNLQRLQQTMTWLRDALQGGVVRDSGFMLRTTTRHSAAPGSATFSTWYKVEDGSLKFLPDWPALENIFADVTVRDGSVDIEAVAASIDGVALEPASATVRASPYGGSLLSVRGGAVTGTAEGIAFLRDTPVRDAVGSFIDDWQASGTVDVGIALDLPLGGNAAERRAERLIDVDVLSTGSELTLPAQALTISDINGRVRYRSDAGLTASGLSARMFEFPIVVGIDTPDGAAGNSTRITSSGRASISALQAWPLQSEFVRNVLDYTSGEIGYTATLDILHRAGPDGVRTRLSLASDLLGLASTLPRPFTQGIDDAARLQLDLAFVDGGELLTARYGDFLSGQLVLDADGIDRGQIYFGDRNRDFTIRQTDANAPGLLINGDLPYFNYGEWEAVADALAAKASRPGRPLAEFLRLIDVNLGQLDIAGQQLLDLNVQVQVADNAWQIRGMSPLLAGRFTVPMDASPWSVDLDYLRFPPREEPQLDADGKPVEEEDVDLLEDVDPVQLHPFDFKTAELSIGEQNLGAFEFSFRPDGSGATISPFRMQAEDSSMMALEGDGGAIIDWRYSNGRHASSYTGVFAATNLAEVLPRWGHGANVVSSDARFAGTLRWEGSPLAFTLREASGQLSLDITDGRFVDIAAGTARVFGALNFDALVRRLQLDFSDIFSSGYTFDTIAGNLTLERGVVTTNEPVVINGPSSRIGINGEINLADETIAADMDVRIPLGQNISMLAGLLGAWPIAVSTYLASIIFAEEVAEFATVIYRLEGPWDNATAAFEAPEGAPAAPAQEP